MKDNTKAKIKELHKFLRKYGIRYEKVIPGERSTLYVTNGIYVSSTGRYYKKHLDHGIDQIAFGMINEYLKEISTAYCFDNYLGDEIEKTKLKILITKSNKAIKENVTTKFVERTRFGGCTDSRKSVTIYDPINQPISLFLKIAPGVGYHEIGHVLYTCSFEKLCDDVRKALPRYEPEFQTMPHDERETLVKDIKDTINALEDGRMENLTANRYGGAIPYFKAVVYNFLLDSIKQRIDHEEKINEFDVALYVGRKYLDRDLRKWIIEKYMECDEEHTLEKAKRVVSYINRFITLSWKKDRKEMLELGMGFFFEFVKPELDKQKENGKPQTAEDMMNGSGTDSNHIKPAEDKKIDDSEEEMLKRVAKSMAEDAKEEAKEEEEEDQGEDQGGDGDREGVDDETPKYDPIESVRKKLSEIEKQLEENAKELEKKAKTTKLKNKNNKDSIENYVTPEMVKDRRALEKTLREFSSMCRNGYRTKKRKGTVDVGEARRQSYKKGMRVFRQYKRNTSKAIDIDVAFCLDVSSSMRRGKTVTLVDEAAKQLWISSKACESIGAKVKIFTFNTTDKGVITQPRESTKYCVPGSSGMTNIGSTMFLAENYLNASNATNKWFIALTDGGIQDEPLQNQILQRMQRDGITCGKINLLYNVEIDEDEDEGFNDECYDHRITMVHDGVGGINTMSNDNIVTFFKKVFEISLKKARV